jgi:hypothetical protein
MWRHAADNVQPVKRARCRQLLPLLHETNARSTLPNSVAKGTQLSQTAQPQLWIGKHMKLLEVSYHQQR